MSTPETPLAPEILLPLPNGGTLRCGAGDGYDWGGYLRLCDADGEELLYWDRAEWRDDPEGAIGAVFAAAVRPLAELRELYRRPLWWELWEEMGDDLPCPVCGQPALESQDGVTHCRACSWQADNPVMRAAYARSREEAPDAPA